MANYKGVYVSGSWIIIFCLAAVMPTIMSQTMLSSGTQQFCPEATINFTCTTTGSSVLAWTSEEFIGSGNQLEVRSADRIGTTQQSSDTVATLIAYNTDGTILTSTLRIITKSTTSNVNVSCINVAFGERSTSIIPPAAVPGVPRNARAAETSARINNNCIILVTWDPPASSNGSDIDHYIVCVPSRNIINIEFSAISVLRVPNCRDNDVILIAAVNRFGCVGPNSSEVRPSLFLDNNAQTAEGGSTTITPINIEGGTNLTSVVTALALVGTFIFVVAILIIALSLYKTGKKIEVREKLIHGLERDVQFSLKLIYHHDIDLMLQELYTALKSQSNDKIQDAAKYLRWKLEKESSKNSIKEKLKDFLEKIQLESGKDMRKTLDKMDSMIEDMGSIDKEFETSVHLLYASTEASNDEHKKVLGDLIKNMNREEVQPDKVIELLLTLCDKLQDTQQAKEYYKNQRKYNVHDLGTEKDRERVPIWIQDTLDGGWKGSLHEAVEAINEAAPGLSLVTTEDEKGAIIHVLAIDKEEAYTEGNILMRSIPENSNFIVKINLGKWEDDRKKGTSIHELLHALGFHRERLQHSDAPPYVYRSCSGKEININENWLNLTRYDPLSLSIMLYPCEKKTECNEHPEVPVWVLKADSVQENRELSELDKVGLNLVYPPCKDTTDDNGYKPKCSTNGMYYCGRQAVTDDNYPRKGYTTVYCGPDSGPNCPACRTIKSPKVKVIWDGGRWQGMTGLVYCGRSFTEPKPVGPNIGIVHDGTCGIDNGPACSDCNAILNKEM